MTEAQKTLLYRIAFLAIVIIAVYGNTLGHRLVWDDLDILVDNPMTDSLKNIPMFFVSEDVADSPTGYYRPITYVSFALDKALWGGSPVGFNVTNLLLHILACVFFYKLVLEWFRKEELALVAALILALNPVAGETVNFHAGGRNTLLCAVFGLLTLLYYSRRKMVPALAFFALAALSKEFALLLPALCFLYDALVSDEDVNWARYLPFVVAIGCYLSLRSYAVHKHANPLSAIELSTVWIMPEIFATYLKNMVFPFQLKVLYDVNTQVKLIPFLGYCVVLAALVAAAVVFRKRREVVFAVVMFFLFLLPVSNLFPLGVTMMADRYAYFPLMGFALGVGYLVTRLDRKLALGVTALLCLAYIPVDVMRNGYWQDEVPFFTQMIKENPDLAIGYQNLGYAYYNSDDYPNSAKYLTIALTKKELNAKALVGSASMLWDMKQYDKALEALTRKMQAEPENPQSYIMASKIYEEMGDKARAKENHDKAAQLSPGIYDMMSQRTLSTVQQGEALLGQHKLAAAERLFKEALAIDPGFVPALLDMGSLQAEKGAPAKALQYLSKAAALEPLNPGVHYNLAQLYEMMGKRAEAAAEMSKYQQLEAQQKGGAPQQ